MNVSAFFKSEDLEHEYSIIRASITNPEYFGPLYEKYYKNVFRFLYQRLNSKDNAHDLTADVFIKALTNLKHYEYRGKPFISWLYRIAYNELMQYFRQSKLKRVINADIQDLKFIQEETEIVYFEEFIPQIQHLITELEPEELSLLEMRYFERRPYKEIAEILEITEVNAKVKMHRIIEKLKLQLRKKSNESRI